MVFASGMAAATTVFNALGPGDHVVAPREMYWALKHWLATTAGRWGLETDFVDMTQPEQVRDAVRPGRTRLIWIETPANPTWSITDIALVAEIAHGAGARLAIDSTAATPVLTRPLALGADIVMHSATKYLNGHSDVIAGALVTREREEFWEKLAEIRSEGGGILGPFEASQLLRGTRTLVLRVRACCESAQRIAEHFEGHDGVSHVLYPGLPSFAGHEIAARQMDGGFGGMLSLRFKGGEAMAIGVAARVDVWKRATSLGGVESLIEHRASIEGPGTPVPADLLRLSVGIEDARDLIADLDQAIERASVDLESEQ
jgi:cystathionine gamma-synthase